MLSSIIIERVEYDDAYEYIIADKFKKDKIGYVDHIDWIVKEDIPGEIYYCANVYYKKWNDILQRENDDDLQSYFINDVNEKDINIHQLIDRIRHLEEINKNNYIKFNDILEQLNEKIYKLSMNIGDILLNHIPKDEPIKTSLPTEGSKGYLQNQPTAGATGPILYNNYLEEYNNYEEEYNINDEDIIIFCF